MRGAASTMLYIVLGLIVLGIILFSAVGPMGLRKIANDAMESMFGVKQFFGELESESFAAPPALYRRNLVLDGDSAVAARQIAEAVVRCYNQIVMEESYARTDCFYVNFSNGPVVYRRDVMNALQGYTITRDVHTEPYTLVEDFSCINDVNYRRGWCLPDALTVFTADFIIGGNYHSNPALIALYLGYDRPMNYRVNLVPDHTLAVHQIACNLARCWAQGAAFEVDGVCAVFDASGLTAPMSKEEVIAALALYADQDAVDALDDWWEPDSGAEMSTVITSATPQFYGCCSDRGGGWAFLYYEALCLTHDLENACCT